ncbi:hypothetical protein CRI77_22425 [Mycolicibacterium duvalii]|uniref:Uncharacterized protein n=1 Tax=Mycolicibacterium duvalii TaxID=39688 RepID=A0A7I7JVF6_9MYCO|nr:hypothetical protein [Mycolicibacterium duvalii]MCV7368530.1 hypothetical protein [Mycolicibacterium duvalii]PEG36738.1 hypothetical protein CRI77_22425 [Mycolicibacterium duvalii]BBX15224.1 hypothetical protein MDUV_00840 [Mycolicibacterium duvalii]
MTATTLTTEAEAAAYTGPACQSCGGPCWQWRGSVWEYTCTLCIDRYLDEAAARWATRMTKQRDKLARQLLHRDESEPLLTNGRRSGDGGPVAYRAAAGASATDTDQPR